MSLKRPSFRRWNRSSRVISLLIEAGGIGAKASFAHRHLAGLRVHDQAVLGAGRDGGGGRGPRPAQARQERVENAAWDGTPQELLVDDDMRVVTTKSAEPRQRRIRIGGRIQRPPCARDTGFARSFSSLISAGRCPIARAGASRSRRTRTRRPGHRGESRREPAPGSPAPSAARRRRGRDRAPAPAGPRP